MENFRRFSRIFLEFSTIFFGIFCDFFGKFSKNFCNFFRLLRFPRDFSRKFFRKFSLTIRYGSTGVSPYCKFTSKFTPKFTPILIKILQSTKFEDSHFFNSFQLLSHFYSFLATFQTLRPLPKPFPLFALLSLRHRVFPTVAPPCQRHQRPSLPLRRRRYVGNTRDYK